MHLGRFGC